MAPKKKKTFNQELEGLDQEELSTFNVEKFYTPKMTDDTKKTMLTAVVGKVQKALGEAIAETNQKTVENGILIASVEEEALSLINPHLSLSTLHTATLSLQAIVPSEVEIRIKEFAKKDPQTNVQRLARTVSTV